MPFNPPDRILKLRVIPPKHFELLESFTYTDPQDRPHQITPEGVGNTDLASVPWFLWWFVASYGRHTAAALAHDQLIETIDRRKADWVFRCALEESGTSFARRWLMWAAVSLETTFRTAFKAKAPTQDDPDRREQRGGWGVTVVGFGLFFGHLALGLVLATGAWRWDFWFFDNSWGGHALSQWLGGLLILAWIAMWRGRGIILLFALLLLAPAIVGVLITAVVFRGFLELGFFGGGEGGIGPTIRPQRRLEMTSPQMQQVPPPTDPGD